MKNFEELSTIDTTNADGIIMYVNISNNRTQAVASTNCDVDKKVMLRFVRAMNLYLETNKSCLFRAEKKITPTIKWWVIFEAPGSLFEREFGWLIECLRQTKVITKPIIFNLTKHQRLLE